MRMNFICALLAFKYWVENNQPFEVKHSILPKVPARNILQETMVSIVNYLLSTHFKQGVESFNSKCCFNIVSAFVASTEISVWYMSEGDENS